MQQTGRLRADRPDLRTMQVMDELKRSVDYIEKTEWMFQRATVDFSSHLPNLQNDELLWLPATSHTPFQFQRNFR